MPGPIRRVGDQRTILEEIVESVREKLAEEQKRVPFVEVRRRAAEVSPPLNFKQALVDVEKDTRIIAEAKRASPSAGLIAELYDPVALALAYQSGGAAALSILTEPRYFQGSLTHLSDVRKAVSIPILRKDFIVSPYQIYQARAAGADAVLLIVRCLEDGEICDLITLANDLGMATLIEAFSEEEVERAATCGADIIGINNRNLADFHTDTGNSLQLIHKIPDECVKVAESGISTREDVERLQKRGFDCFLVGETLMRSSDPSAKIRELCGVS